MKNYLDELRSGLVITNLKGDVRHPMSYLMDRVPTGYNRWSIASQYFWEVERILSELKSAVSFVKNLPDDNYIATHLITVESYVLYHQGYFLDLVHQLKDKMCQMVRAVATPAKDYDQSYEKSTKISRLLKDPHILRFPGLAEKLEHWDSDLNKGKLSIVLKKRTNYHHFKNPLTREKDYLQVINNRTLLSPQFQQHLNEYGKQIVAERSKKSFQSWHSEVERKMNETLEEVNQNVQGIARCLVSYLNLPKNDRDGGRIIVQQLKLDEVYGVKQALHAENSIHYTVEPIIHAYVAALSWVLQKNLLAFYITGSVLRNEYIFGISDVNIVVVLEENDAVSNEYICKIIDAAPQRLNMPTDTKILTKKQFLDESHDWVRFACKSDGLLLHGEDFLKNGNLPTANFKLAWRLISDFKERVLMAKDSISKDPTMPPNRLSIITRDIAKRAYRLSFSLVIGNEGQYTASFREMRRLLNFFYPENRMLNDKIYQAISRRITVDREAALSLIDIFYDKLMPLYKKIDELGNIKPKKKTPTLIRLET